MIRRVFIDSTRAWSATAPGDVVQAKHVRAVYLDPAYCPPGYRLAVAFDGNGTPQILAPGDIAIAPKGSGSTFRAWNHRAWLTSSPFVQIQLSLGNVLRPVGLLCSDDPGELVALVNNNRQAHGAYATLASLWGTKALQAQAEGVPPSRYIIADGLSGLRVSALAFDGANTMLAAAPANFAATIRLWRWVGFRDAARNFLSIGEVVPRGDNQGVIGTYLTPCWASSDEANLDATQTGFTFDRSDVVASFAFGFTCTALAGAGVTHVGLVVEGF